MSKAQLPIRGVIHRDPGILGGKPVIAGTRISVEFILELLASGMTTIEICREYDLDQAAVASALTYAAEDLKRSDAVEFA